MKQVENAMGPSFENLLRQQGMRNLLFQIDYIIDEPNSLDVWVVHHPEKDVDKYHSLYNLLWKISFDAN